MAKITYTERDIEIAYLVGKLNRGLSIAELIEELKTSKEQLADLKAFLEQIKPKP